MASMRGIKRRKESVTSTQQITKAMKLVATVKLQKARAKAEDNKPYFNMLHLTICSILAKTGKSDNRFLQENPDAPKAVIAITGNRGLAGGYNSNIVKLIDAQNFPKENTRIYGVGRKGIEGLSRKGYQIYRDYSDVINEPLYNDAIELTKELLEEFEAGRIGEIYMAYTDFKNTVVHEPTLIKLLPLDADDFKQEEPTSEDKLQMNFEPSEEEVLNRIIPKYMTNIIFGGYLASIASENGARMQAMDSATSNADEMISSLSLQYNRARQSSITQELTEIIAGSEAIN
jgi:F-type H+-transporting ATPase subunit gamma